MPSKSISKAFIIILSIALVSLLSGSVFAEDCDPSSGKQCYYYDELSRLKEVHYPDGTKIIYNYDKLGNRTYTEMYKSPFTLTVQRAGTGTGTVTSNPEGIACGALCSRRFSGGSAVTLTAATDDPCMVFAGWNGGGCSGMGTCTVAMSAATTVTATFRWVTPTADFTAEPTAESAPFDAAFTDNSICATSRSWNFGDVNMNTSTAKTPTHTYSKPGTYTVTLTASNPQGTSTNNALIKADPCPHYPAKIDNTNTYYKTITEAVSAAESGDTIRFHAVDLRGPVSINKELTLNGGYNCWYETRTVGATVIQGDVTIESEIFSVTMDHFLID